MRSIVGELTIAAIERSSARYEMTRVIVADVVLVSSIEGSSRAKSKITIDVKVGKALNRERKVQFGDDCE